MRKRGFPIRLAHRVVIRRYSSTNVSASGVATPEWATLATVYAEVKPMAGVEKLVADQMVAFSPYRFTMRYRSDLAVTVKDRLEYGGYTFDIHSVQHELMNGRWVHLIAERTGLVPVAYMGYTDNTVMGNAAGNPMEYAAA